MADDALRIGEVAARSGVTRKALRLYEARGIVPKPRRTAAGYRVYPPDVLGVLHFVTQARRLGLTLKEIGHIVALRYAKPGPCVHVRALLKQKLAELDSLRREVKKILNTWDASSARRGVVCQHIEGGKPTCLKCEIVDTYSIPARLTCRSLRPMTTTAIRLHKEALQWFGKCTRELGIAPLTPIS